MRVLLFNDNPVVTKLVTLSAQKTGDQLEVCSDIKVLNPGEYKLLIVDDGLYNDESAAILGSSITASQHLFMSNRDTEVPAGFEHKISKPFLPTDLVELLSSISAMHTDAPAQEEERVESVDVPDDETFDLDGLDDELIFDEEDANTADSDAGIDELDDIDGLELDDLEAASDDAMDLDFEIGDNDDEAEASDLLMDEDDVSAEGVLDKEDLAEVQSLLEDTEDTQDDGIETGSLDDEGLVGLEVDIDDSDALDEDIQDAALLDSLDDVSLDETLLDDDEALHEDETLDESPETGDNEDDLPLDEEVQEDDFDLEALLESNALSDEDDKIAEEAEDDTVVQDDEVVSGFEDDIESAISELSDEDLDESVDEDTLLDIVNNTETFDEFSGLDDLDEQSLKAAVGEVDTADIKSVEDDEEAKVSHEELSEPVAVSNDKLEGTEALKALLRALENEDVAKSLKGMNISINISFGENS